MADSSTGDPDADAVLSGSATPTSQQHTLTGDPDADAVLQEKEAASETQETGTALEREVLRPLGLAARAAATGVAGLPLLAMNAGVGARNLVTGSNYELPGKMFEDSLTDLGLPQPKGWGEKAISMIESGLTGAAMPGPAVAGGAASSPLTGAQQTALKAGKSVGMRATPGTESGSVPLLQLESKLESQPWTSGPASALSGNNQAALNRSWARAIGEDGDTVDSSVLAKANDRLGTVFESVRDQRARTIDPTQFGTTMKAINDEFDGLLPNGMQATDHPLVQRLVNLAESGSATGEQLGSITSKLSRVANKEMTSPTGDRDLGMALFRVKDYADDLVAQGLKPDELAEYNTARQQYRALMQLTARVPNLNTTTGNVSGANIASYLQKFDRRGYLFGENQSDAYNATRFAQAFKPIVGNSGTATRSMDLTDALKLPLGLPANLLSRAYYRGLLTPGMPSASTLGATAMAAISASEDQSQQ